MLCRLCGWNVNFLGYSHFDSIQFFYPSILTAGTLGPFFIKQIVGSVCNNTIRIIEYCDVCNIYIYISALCMKLFVAIARFKH